MKTKQNKKKCGISKQGKRIYHIHKSFTKLEIKRDVVKEGKKRNSCLSIPKKTSGGIKGVSKQETSCTSPLAISVIAFKLRYIRLRGRAAESAFEIRLEYDSRVTFVAN
ncbi:hypothetical protein CDAR_36461 [Caerostris darwini]|uniref:Uncharacterized protein n=1 Tax=Caerostris darwini TaxID=1538125 RepID=A0AAV4PJD4_9ARAC|nr:hypothetical protein CDAR_36461 [Caerostris darwini]